MFRIETKTYNTNNEYRHILHLYIYYNILLTESAPHLEFLNMSLEFIINNIYKHDYNQ